MRKKWEYAYMAQQLLQGVLPYTEAHSMKFPGIFLVYAAVLAIFGQTPVAIHLSLLFVNLCHGVSSVFTGEKFIEPVCGYCGRG